MHGSELVTRAYKFNNKLYNEILSETLSTLSVFSDILLRVCRKN